MKAMVFAAGVGSRLKPITDHIPKALVEVGGEPVLGLQLRRLAHFGFTSIVVNVHHHSDKVRNFLSNLHLSGVEIEISDETDGLLDTGGGLWKASPFFNEGEPFLVHNVDILSNADLDLLYQQHKASKALATLLVSERESSRHFLFNAMDQLRGWENVKTGVQKLPCRLQETLTPLAFSGIHVINPTIFSLHHQNGSFSIIDTYLQLCCYNSILGHKASSETVIHDIGTPQKLEEANRLMAEGVFTLQR